MSIVEYKVVASFKVDKLREFEALVTEHLNKGWKLVGGLIIRPASGRMDYLQAMTKEGDV